MECWGGATFDSCLRFLNEDPWIRLKKKEAMPKNQASNASQRSEPLGYKHYADDVVELFCDKAIQNGIQVMRIFDALNDVRNLETSIKATKAAAKNIK